MADSPPLRATLTSPSKRCVAGEAFALEARIVNVGTAGVWAIGSVPDIGFPWLHVDVKRVDAKGWELMAIEWPRTKKGEAVQELRREHLALVEPGGSFDPFGKGFTADPALTWRPTKPGRYEITFVYNTDDVVESDLAVIEYRRFPELLHVKLESAPLVIEVVPKTR